MKTISKQAIELMFGAYQRQLLATLLLRPDEHFHVRELARITGLSAGTIHRELRKLAEGGLLNRSEVGNQVHYQANLASPIFEELASIFRKTIGLADVLRDALSNIPTVIEFAFVYGSMADGRHSHSSDIDVLILAEVSLLDVVRVLTPLSTRLGREINPVVMKVDDFLAQMHQLDRFITRVVNEPKIFVMGDEDEFAELVANRAA